MNSPVFVSDYYTLLQNEIYQLNQVGKKEKVLEKINAIIKEYPEHCWGYAAKANYYSQYKLNNNDDKMKNEIVELFQKAIYLSFREKRFSYLSQIYEKLADFMVNNKKMLESINYYNLAIEYCPKEKNKYYATLQFRLASSLLLIGDYEAGFSKYHYLYVDRDEFLRHLNVPYWRGEPKVNGAIYLHNEQALGDYLMYFRFIRDLKPLFKKIFIEIRPRMKKLSENSPLILNDPNDPNSGIDEQFIFVDRISNGPQTEVDGQFDCHAHMSMLPYYFRVKKESDLKANLVPYFSVDTEIKERIKLYMSQFDGKYKIAINWCGDKTNQDDIFRMLPYQKLVDLKNDINSLKVNHKIQLFSIQKFNQIDLIQDKDEIIDLGSKLDKEQAFVGTAAVLKNVDLLITSDTAIAHLGGCLGIDTWVLMKYNNEWRWLVDREDSPWYKDNFRIFQQKKQGEWDDVFERVTADLILRLKD